VVARDGRDAVAPPDAVLVGQQVGDLLDPVVEGLVGELDALAAGVGVERVEVAPSSSKVMGPSVVVGCGAGRARTES
jgi:hypothetical protein